MFLEVVILKDHNNTTNNQSKMIRYPGGIDRNGITADEEKKKASDQVRNEVIGFVAFAILIEIGFLLIIVRR